MSDRPPERVRVRRNPKKGHHDRARIDAILDRALVAHVAFIDNGEPVCIPMLFAHSDGIQIHGSTASRAMRLLSRGEPARVTVTPAARSGAGALGVRAHRHHESVIAFGRSRATRRARAPTSRSPRVFASCGDGHGSPGRAWVRPSRLVGWATTDQRVVRDL